MAETCAAFGVAAGRRDGHPGCWVEPDAARPRKIGALGIRVERGVSYHGIALNVDPDLADFELIDACGMPGVVSTSVAEELGRTSAAPSTGSVAEAAARFARALATALAAPIDGALPPEADPEREMGALETLLDAAAPSETGDARAAGGPTSAPDGAARAAGAGKAG